MLSKPQPSFKAKIRIPILQVKILRLRKLSLPTVVFIKLEMNSHLVLTDSKIYQELQNPLLGKWLMILVTI